MHGQQGLVGGDDVLAGGDRLHHQRARNAGAADELDDDVDLGVGDHLARIGDDAHAVADERPGRHHIASRDHRDFDAAPGPAANFFLVAAQHLERAAADGAGTEQAGLYGFGFDIGSLSLRQGASCCHLRSQWLWRLR